MLQSVVLLFPKAFFWFWGFFLVFFKCKLVLEEESVKVTFRTVKALHNKVNLKLAFKA